MDELLAYLIIGVFSGGVYSLIALGLVIIFKTTKTLNFAVGEMVVMGGLITVSLMNTGLPHWVAIILGVAIGGAIGLLFQKVILSSFIKRPILDTLIVTCFIIYLLEGLNGCGWGVNARFFPAFLPQWHLNIGDIIISSEIMWSFIVGIALSFILVIVFRYTKLGLGLRAVADADTLARSKGISISSTHSIVWALGGIAAVVGGTLFGYISGISPTEGTIGLRAIPVAFLGGLESPSGAIVAGLIIGIVERLTEGYLSSSWASMAPFIILLAVLLVRPQGLLGQRATERV